jgi:hypothetical protein
MDSSLKFASTKLVGKELHYSNLSTELLQNSNLLGLEFTSEITYAQ